MSLCLPQQQVLSKKTILTHIQVVAVRVDVWEQYQEIHHTRTRLILGIRANIHLE